MKARKTRSLLAGGILALTLTGTAACGNDEDGDGAKMDEEIDQVDQTVDSVADQVETEVEEGTDAVDDG